MLVHGVHSPLHTRIIWHVRILLAFVESLSFLPLFDRALLLFALFEVSPVRSYSIVNNVPPDHQPRRYDGLRRLMWYLPC